MNGTVYDYGTEDPFCYYIYIRIWIYLYKKRNSFESQFFDKNYHFINVLVRDLF